MNPNNEDDMNFKKIQNSKLFQKFMKEEISNEIDSQPNLYENYRCIFLKILFNYLCILVKNSSKRKKSPLPVQRKISDKNEGGEQELAGYSQIFVPGRLFKKIVGFISA